MASNLLTRVPPLFSDLAKILAGDIDCSTAALDKHSNDGSPYTIQPQAVLYPKNTTDIKHILGFAREYTMPVTVCGNGTRRTGGSLGEGLIINMARYFSQIRNINMMENTITVDAGVSIGMLLEKLHSWHYDIPFFMGSDSESTIGSLVATKSSSGSSFHHGTVREWIEGITVVVDNGEEHHLADGISPSGRILGIYQELFPLLTKENPTLRASKPISHDDASGYNLWTTSIGPRQLIDQLLGSEGTLGIITSITFRICPYKPHLITTCIPVQERKLLPVYIDIAKHHKAEHLFIYDESFMNLSERYHPTLVPFFQDTPYTLMITHTGIDKEKLHQTVETFTRALPCERHALKTIQERKRTERIISSEFLFSLYASYTQGKLYPNTTCSGLIVTVHQLALFLEQLEGRLSSYGRFYTITGNVGSGALSIVSLFDPQSKKYDSDLLFYTKEIFSLLKQHNGGISARDGEGIIKAPFISYIYNEQTLALFKKIKTIWDPLSILNPGKKYGTQATYLQGHTRRIPS